MINADQSGGEGDSGGAVPPHREAAASSYRRYHIATEEAADIISLPPRFRVEVRRHRLAWMILKEMVHYRGRWDVVLSRPCVYGVFSGPVGGFAPREHLCVGCLRCTTEYPDVVQIHRNPERDGLGDSYLTPETVDTVTYEARTGRIPVRGAGYRGAFGGEGWDGMWTDMSEIVRPTRDGIHGREYISTDVDLGAKLAFLEFDGAGTLRGSAARILSLPIPMLFDVPPRSALLERLVAVLAQAAREVETLALLPLSVVVEHGLRGAEIVPVVTPGEADGLAALPFEPAMIELAGGGEAVRREAERRFPDAVLALRLPMGPGLAGAVLGHLESDLRVFHLAADYHGQGGDGGFVLDRIREVHGALVAAGRREEVTLLGSGGIVAAEHVAKAIICGLDAVALDTPLLVALQAKMSGECIDAETSRFDLPRFDVAWGVQRLKNVLGAWRDQLLEVLGAMGMREVRRLRGETGRAMFQAELEREAFAGIAGYGAG